jgi:SAM-dependent methyltransferase
MTLRFYRNKLPYKEKQFNKIFQLDYYFGEMIGNKKIVDIADLGAGMFSTTGSTWPETEIHLYPSDLLADEYNSMLVEKGVIPEIRIEKQDMRLLTYDNEQFDIVHCVNSLDHCGNPLLAIREMYRVCKVGGWIYLRHYVDNGKLHNYANEHRWNISPISGGMFFIWSRHATLIDPLFEKFTNYVTEDYPGKVIISKLRKDA